MKRGVDTNRNKFNWLHIHQMQFRQGHASMLFRSECFGDEEFRVVDMLRRGKTLDDLKQLKLRKLYDGEIPIEKAKYKDLMEQLPFIPPIHHHFYKQLKTCKCKVESTCNCDYLTSIFYLYFVSYTSTKLLFLLIFSNSWLELIFHQLLIFSWPFVC